MSYISSNFSSRKRLIRQLLRKQGTAETQDEWMDIAEQIDGIQGNDKWRNESDCALYEADRISSRIDEIVQLIRQRHVFDLMFTLRGGISRNKFGLLHEGLFSKAMAGSKVLVETYHNIVCNALDFVCDAPNTPNYVDTPIPTDARLAFFNETRHSYGRTALMLSGGAALGFYHVGVVKSLMQNGLMPRVLSGASAGSVVCAMIGTRTNEECSDLFNVKGTSAHGHSNSLKFDFFRPIGHHAEAMARVQSNPDGIQRILTNSAGPLSLQDPKRTWQIIFPIGLRNFTSKIYDILSGHTRAKDILMSDTNHFRMCCKVNIGNFTFQEAFDRTGRILNITVSPQNRSDPPRLLNYLTAPHVLVWSAAVCSSSLPGVFESNKLLVRDSDGSERFESGSGGRFQDGSMEADLPMQQLSEMFNINHFIISQANPHAVMFSSLSLSKSIWTSPVLGVVIGVSNFVKNQVKAWIRHFVELVGGRRVAPHWDTRRSFVSQFFTQEYEGRDFDITINPWAGHISLFQSFRFCLYNPSKEEFQAWIDAAAKETWKYLPAIKSHIAEEVTLDRCVQRLRKKVLAESYENRNLHHASNTTETTEEKMGKRVPSFFTSPSLVNFGGLNVGDGYELSSTDNGELSSGQSTPVVSHLDLHSGWGGMGLRGNHSQASLARSTSGGSGLFIIDDSDDEASMPGSGGKEDHVSFSTPSATNYIKTCSMASFYYQKAASHDNLRRASWANGDSSEISYLMGDDDAFSASNPNGKKNAKSHLDLSEHGRANSRVV